MSIGYIIQKKLIQVGANPGLKFLARIFREKPVTQDTIAKSISDRSSLSIGDVYSVFQGLKEEIAKYLSEGKTIKIEFLGTFYPSIKAIAKESIEEVKSTTIETVNIRFLPSKELIGIVRAAGVKYINIDIKGVQYRDSAQGRMESSEFDSDNDIYDPESENFDPEIEEKEQSPDKKEQKGKK